MNKIKPGHVLKKCKRCKHDFGLTERTYPKNIIINACSNCAKRKLKR